MRKLAIGFLVLLVFTSVMWPFLFGFGMVAALLSLADEVEEFQPKYSYEYERGDEDSENKILAVKVFGPILDIRRGRLNPFDEVLTEGVTYGYEVKEVLMQAAVDDSIKGVVLEVSSPGGTVTGSRAIADGVEYFRERSGKPVVGYGSGLVASGAYWAIISADKVYSDVGSLVGSIGVIGGVFPIYNEVVELGQGVLGPNVVTREGIEMVTITAGEGKDFGNPFREPTEKELRIAQQGADDAYEVFVDYVSRRRGREVGLVRGDWGAYVFGEEQALKLGMIDEVANREQVFDLMAGQLKIGDDFQVVTSKVEGNFWSEVLGVWWKGGMMSVDSGEKGCGSGMRRVMAYFGDITRVCGWLR